MQKVTCWTLQDGYWCIRVSNLIVADGGVAGVSLKGSTTVSDDSLRHLGWDGPYALDPFLEEYYDV